MLRGVIYQPSMVEDLFKEENVLIVSSKRLSKSSQEALIYISGKCFTFNPEIPPRTDLRLLALLIFLSHLVQPGILNYKDDIIMTT